LVTQMTELPYWYSQNEPEMGLGARHSGVRVPLPVIKLSEELS